MTKLWEAPDGSAISVEYEIEEFLERIPARQLRPGLVELSQRERDLLKALEWADTELECARLARIAAYDERWRAYDELTTKAKTATGGRGSRSHMREMAVALSALLAEGRRFPTKKAAHRTVLERLGISETARGWSCNTFTRLKLQNRNSVI
jgi:hypothetical protein